MRLQGGTRFPMLQGRLEICHNNIWGTVCGDFFDTALAPTYVCDELGLRGMYVQFKISKENWRELSENVLYTQLSYPS